jgi:predicted RNase H-like HicB family nuclease
MKTVDQLLAMPYPVSIAVERDSNGNELFAAWLLDMPGCVAQADSRPAARAALDAIKAPYFQQLLEIGAPIPEPTALPALIPGHMAFYDPLTGATLHPAESTTPEVKLGAGSGFHSIKQVA